MNRNFIFFINPISGTKNKAALKPLIEKRMNELKLPFCFIDTQRNGNYDFLPSLIQEQQVTDIVICGGDGTVNQVAAHLLNIKVNVGIIPMGSGNGLAFTAGIPKNPGKALEIIIQGEATYIDSFYINGQFSCMLCGLGLDAQVAHDFAKQRSRGLSTYVKQSIRNFFSAKAYPFTITTENISIHTHAFFISIANSNQFGNNVTIAPKASLSDGLLDIVVVNKMNKMKMIYSFARQVTSGKVQEQFEKDRSQKSIQYFQAKNIIIHNPGNAPLHIDGEPASTSEKFEIKIIERAFRLICKK
ncbi:MAG: YegS/Rv2252/BmrU family lipid kinase [Bacteroidetes bacterium]|nr:YegS/Rv2252/BmrU family lipid kinase [Bacteroidota bacterium]